VGGPFCLLNWRSNEGFLRTDGPINGITTNSGDANDASDDNDASGGSSGSDGNNDSGDSNSVDDNNSDTTKPSQYD
jgi:hypothetical protein